MKRFAGFLIIRALNLVGSAVFLIPRTLNLVNSADRHVTTSEFAVQNYLFNSFAAEFYVFYNSSVSSTANVFGARQRTFENGRRIVQIDSFGNKS